MTGVEVAITRIKNAKENQIKFLDLSGLGLDCLPVNISDMWYLADLDLSNNRLIILPEEITNLTNIRFLNLRNNFLSDLPFRFGYYYSFVEIDFSNNAFNFIPEQLFNFHEEVALIYDGNPFLENIPSEIKLSNDLSFISYYIDSLRVSNQNNGLYETKLLFVGKGEVGKTTLMKVIQNPDFKVKIGKEKTTHGIEIINTEMEVFFPCKKPHCKSFQNLDNLYVDSNEFDYCTPSYEYMHVVDYLQDDLDYLEEIKGAEFPGDHLPKDSYIKKNVKINIWDFGGQELLYSTHQFFLTQRSVYIFVWEPRTDNEEESFDYWLNTINRLGKNSPVIVIMNKSDIRIKNIDEVAYKKKFDNIRGFYKLSCYTKEGVKVCIDEIKKCISTLPHMGDKMPQVWNLVRKSIKKSKVDYVSFSEFKEICKTSDDNEALYLSSYLSDLGDIIHFEDDIVLQDLVILNPNWLTKAIYELIHSLEVQKNKGLFKSSDLSKLLNSKKYPKNKYFEILLLMERFEICFKVQGKHDIYVIPALLQSTPADEGLIESFVKAESLKFEIYYKTAPYGIIERLICKLNNYLKQGIYWKYGAVFKTEHGESIVYFDKIEKKISVFVIGSLKTNLYNIIRHELNDIHLTLKLNSSDYKEVVACNCIDCSLVQRPYMFDIKTLNKFISKSKYKIDCQESAESVNIKELLQGYKSKNSRKSLVREFIGAFSKLQSRHSIIREFGEDALNTYFQDLLRPLITKKGYYSNEQSLKGVSQSRKRTGELDINIETIEGESVTFFEGFILTSLNKTVIEEHVRKTLDNYDPNGLKEKYIGVYCRSKNFESLVRKYEDYISSSIKNDFPIESIENLSQIYVGGSEIKLIKCTYVRSGERLTVFHILVNLEL